MNDEKTQKLLFSLGELRPKAIAKAGTPEAGLDKYLARTIRRVTLFFAQSEYSRVIAELAELGKKLGTENNTDTVRRLISEEIKRKKTEL
jgi:hypothetical protein